MNVVASLINLSKSRCVKYAIFFTVGCHIIVELVVLSTTLFRRNQYHQAALQQQHNHHHLPSEALAFLPPSSHERQGQTSQILRHVNSTEITSELKKTNAKSNAQRTIRGSSVHADNNKAIKQQPPNSEQQEIDLPTLARVEKKFHKTHPPPLQSSSKASSKTVSYAYASILGGCHPDRPGYRGYLYNVMLTAQVLHEEGSHADFIVLIQMSSDTTAEKLPDMEETWLHTLDIQIQYVPKSSTESFYESMMDKFRILDWKQYQRVLFLDADVLVLANLDYLFHMSDRQNKQHEQPQPALMENLVMAGTQEPASGGFFLVAPGLGRWHELQAIVAEHEAKNATGRNFDYHSGWGHPFAPPRDVWESNTKKGTDWSFPGGHADQGLLYHWTKYVQKSVSIVIGNRVENWKANDADGTLVLQSTLENPFAAYEPRQVFMNECLRWKQKHCVNPYKSILHFTGKSKPWLAEWPPLGIGANNTAVKKMFWWWRLKLLNDQLNMGLDFGPSWTPLGKPPLGFMPKYHN